MTAEEFRTRWTGHVPKVQDVTGGSTPCWCPWWSGRRACACSMRCGPTPWAASRGRCAFPAGGWSRGRTRSPAPCGRRGRSWAFPRPAVEVVAELDWLTHQGGFVLYPVLGIVAPEAAERLHPGPAEVKETFFVPVDWLRAHPPEVYAYPLEPRVGGGLPL